jgi:hypothetical protein
MCLKLSYLAEILERQTVHHDVDLLLDGHINFKGFQTPYLQKARGCGAKFATTDTRRIAGNKEATGARVPLGKIEVIISKILRSPS